MECTLSTETIEVSRLANCACVSAVGAARKRVALNAVSFYPAASFSYVRRMGRQLVNDFCPRR